MPSNFKFDLSSLRGLALTHDSLILGKVVRPVLLEGFYTFVKTNHLSNTTFYCL